MGLFFGYFVLTCGCFYLLFSIYYAIYVSNLCKFMGDDKDKNVQEYLSNRKEDAEGILAMNILNFFIVSIISLLTFGSIEVVYFNFVYFIICFIIFGISFYFLHKSKMGSKLYLRVRDLYILENKLEEIKDLIDNLESRKKVLTTYDEDDKYRSPGVIEEEIKDLDLSIELLKEMYSNIELNYSYKKVNDLFNSLKNKGAFTNQANLEDFQNKVDTMNARKILDKNIDVNLEKLKNKYK